MSQKQLLCKSIIEVPYAGVCMPYTGKALLHDILDINIESRNAYNEKGFLFCSTADPSGNELLI